MEKKIKKTRWRYFIDKPFQIRFIGRFFVLILLGFTLSLGIILLLDNFKFMLGTLHFRALNIEEMTRVETGIKKLENTVSMLENPAASLEIGKTASDIDVMLSKTASAGYQISAADATNLVQKLEGLVQQISTNSMGMNNTQDILNGALPMILSSDYQKEQPAVLKSVHDEIRAVKNSMDPVATTRAAVSQIKSTAYGKSVKSDKNPYSILESSASKAVNDKSGNRAPYINDYKSAIDFLAKNPEISKAVNNSKRIREVSSSSPDEAFALTIDRKGLNSFELLFVPIMLVSIVYIILITVFGLFISHKMAGPIYRIKKTLEEATKGSIDIKTLEFRLRRRDELQDLVKAMNKFLEKMNKQ